MQELLLVTLVVIVIRIIERIIVTVVTAIRRRTGEDPIVIDSDVEDTTDDTHRLDTIPIETGAGRTFRNMHLLSGSGTLRYSSDN